VDNTGVSASFGQFAFDDLRPETYEILVEAKGGLGYEGGTRISIDVDPSSFDLNKVAIPLKPSEPEVLFAQKGGADTSDDDPPKQQVTMSATPP